MPHHVYLVRCADRSLYAGYTVDPARRLLQHNQGTGAKYTRARRPVEMVACWEYPDKSQAMSAEVRLKRLTRARKLELIDNGQAP